MPKGANAVRFSTGVRFCEYPGLFWFFVRSSACLSFFSRRVFGDELWTWGGLSGEFCVVIRVCKGETLCVFLPGTCFWSLSAPVRESPRSSSCRFGKKSIYWGDFAGSFGLGAYGFRYCVVLSLLFCVFIFPTKTIFFCQPCLFRRFCCHILRSDFWIRTRGCGGWFSALKSQCFAAPKPTAKIHSVLGFVFRAPCLLRFASGGFCGASSFMCAGRVFFDCFGWFFGFFCRVVEVNAVGFGRSLGFLGWWVFGFFSLSCSLPILLFLPPFLYSFSALGAVPVFFSFLLVACLQDVDMERQVRRSMRSFILSLSLSLSARVGSLSLYIFLFFLSLAWRIQT